MNDKDVKRWYHDNGIPYLEEDWGERAETGESIGPQTQEGGRTREVRSAASTPDRMWWWEKQQYPWRSRTNDEKRWIYLLDAFFVPYVAMLPRAKGNLVRQVFGERLTYQEVADEAGVRRQSAHEAVWRAIQDLTRLIAEDDPHFVPPEDGRRRDHAAETEAARRVFNAYLRRETTKLEEEER